MSKGWDQFSCFHLRAGSPTLTPSGPALLLPPWDVGVTLLSAAGSEGQEQLSCSYDLRPSSPTCHRWGWRGDISPRPTPQYGRWATESISHDHILGASSPTTQSIGSAILCFSSVVHFPECCSRLGETQPLPTKRCQGTGPAFLGAGAGKGESALSSVADGEGQGTREDLSPTHTSLHRTDN